MERIERIGPTPAEVMSKWELPNIAEQTSAAGPVEAFRLFMDYAERALDHKFERELQSAWHFDACHTGEIQPNKDRHYIASAETEERITQDVSTALHARIAPLLPAIHSYMSNRPNDPATVNRLAWMAEQIEAIPGALEGRALWRSREQPEGFLMRRKFEPMAWKELHDGLLEILNTATVNSGRVAAAPARSTERIVWTSSTAAFEYIFSTLAARGYFKIPPKRGKEGEPNLTALARALLLAFDVKGEGEGEGKDRKSLNAEQLRVRFSPGSEGKLTVTKQGKFQIPASNELVIPNVDELE